MHVIADIFLQMSHIFPFYRDKIQVRQGRCNKKLSQKPKTFSALRARNVQNQEKIPFSETLKYTYLGAFRGQIKN